MAANIVKVGILATSGIPLMPSSQEGLLVTNVFKIEHHLDNDYENNAIGTSLRRSFFFLKWLFVALLVPSPVLAQDSSQTTLDGQEIEEVVVIGSLIKRREVYEGRAPIQTLDTALFEDVGAAQTVDILASLTANTGSYLATQQNYSARRFAVQLAWRRSFIHANVDKWSPSRIRPSIQ